MEVNNNQREFRSDEQLDLFDLMIRANLCDGNNNSVIDLNRNRLAVNSDGSGLLMKICVWWESK